MSDEKKYDFTKEEAFDLGVIQGQIGVLEEIVNLDSNYNNFILAYVKARLASLKNGVVFISKYRRHNAE